jgi:inorganic phosphate transporter, PiT family
MSDVIFWTIVVLSGAMSYSIGANDAANALGTSYGSNAAKLWILLGLGAIFEFIGAVWCSQKVAGTLADTLIPDLNTASADIQERLMLGVCLSSFSFILFASVFGMPISGTHTVIGALVGAGLAGFAADTLNWKKLI